MIGINMRILNKNKKKAFTLIEVLVTALIFSIVIGAATGVFVSAIKLQRYNLTHQQLLSQVSYAMEYMERAIRMAIKDDGFCGFVGQNYNYTASSIQFQTYDGVCQTFSLNSGSIKTTKTGANGYNNIDLTSDDFEVKSFNVVVSGDIPGESPNFQPKVTIFIEIEGKGSGKQPGIKIQTTISQRNLDL